MESALILLNKAFTTPPLLAFPNFSHPFIVHTDASSKAVGSVLAYKREDGKIHPVQYASRAIKAAENNYTTCESEALVFIFTLNELHIYLLSSERFTVVTDHMAFKYALQKKDIHGSLARWLNFLA